MKVGLNRREFVNSLAALPLAAKAVLAAQDPKPSFPIIATHIHLFDKTRPEGAPYPRDMPGGGAPPQGKIALPTRYQAITAPFGVVGAGRAHVGEAGSTPRTRPSGRIWTGCT